MTTRDFTYTILSLTAGVPDWFTNLAPFSWLPIQSTLQDASVSSTYVWPTDPDDPLTPASPVLGGQGQIMSSPSNYCQNSNGMAVDAVHGDCFLVANGGHAGYMGNETMRLNLRTEIPVWERYIDSTPPWHVSSIQTGSESYAGAEFTTLINGVAVNNFAYHCYTDGPNWTYPTADQANSVVTRRPVSSHTACLPTYSEGKVWLPLQNSTNLEGGTSTFAKLAVDIESRRNDSSLKLWQYGDIRPWEFHGVMDEATTLQPKSTQTQFLFPTAALDPSTGRIWICPAGTSGIRYYWMLETRGVNAGRHQTFTNTGISIQTDNAVGGDITTGVTDVNGDEVKLFILYGYRLKARDVYVLNITAVETQYDNVFPYSGVLSTNAWAKYVATDNTSMRWVSQDAINADATRDPNGTWGPQQAWGCFWHEGSNGLLMFNCDQAVDINRQRDGHLRKLALPRNASGQYDPTVAWKYHDVPIGGTIPGTCLDGVGGTSGLVRGGSFSRFNVMRDFDGIGNDLVVSVNAWNNATSVMKLPQTGV
jgi:hypothetical protein